MIAQEKQQARQQQLACFEREKKERDLEIQVEKLTSAIAFKEKEVLEIQHELERVSGATVSTSKKRPREAPPKAGAENGSGHIHSGAAPKMAEEADNMESDRLNDFFTGDSIDSLAEEQSPDEEALLATEEPSRHKGAANFRSLTKKEAPSLKPLRLHPASGR